MTFEKRPFLRRLSRVVRHFLPRGMILLAAALFSVMPAWVAARTLTAACSEQAPETSPAEPLDEEEAPEAALHRHHVEIQQASPRRAESASVGGVAVRHRMEWDATRAALRWQRYQAPPRAPPHRLLN